MSKELHLRSTLANAQHIRSYTCQRIKNLLPPFSLLFGRVVRDTYYRSMKKFICYTLGILFASYPCSNSTVCINNIVWFPVHLQSIQPDVNSLLLKFPTFMPHPLRYFSRATKLFCCLVSLTSILAPHFCAQKDSI